MTAKVRTANADQRVRDVLVSITKAQAEGVSSLRGIAAALNARGVTAPRGGEWSAAQVKRLLDRQ